MRTLKLITRFYSGIFLANFLVTLSCIGIIGFYGVLAHKLMGILFWYKIISIGMIFSTAVYYKKREMYYYQNLGVSKIKLLIATSLFDFMLWLVVVIIAYR
ncbi:hypothetical protein [Mucilaginibacter xinganensis]|uniref:Uncharacterized protein n=1 Tax=Mucilaginibacter xinganensis TaxID=1234841 RepID=A0A223NT26_9SPHI|nr:hypothetical protein [Mucilaginibacter xinganensis]ASU32966.1 hypothetical protein MuYL_1066 [Mucilaginibacter xinganensis]